MLPVIFWTCVGIILYVYIGYPALLWLLAWVRPRPLLRGETICPVTLVIPAHNEERWIQLKIENTLALDYPVGLLKTIIACDGCTDKTVEIAREFESEPVRIVVFPRTGKQGMINALLPQIETEIAVFTDANALLEPQSLRLLVRHFSDPHVACVTGNRTCILQAQNTASLGEGLYWRYESLIKTWESKLHSCMGAYGQLYAVRKTILPHVENVGEDYYIPMKIIESRGMRVIFEPKAMTRIPAAATLGIEFERKARAHVSGLLTMCLLPRLFNPFRSPVWWEHISHHLLRIAVPPAMVAAFLSSAFLATRSGFYFFVSLSQALFYLLAGVGYFLALRGRRMKIFYLPFYFAFANAALALSLLRWPLRKYEYAWQRTERLTDMD